MPVWFASGVISSWLAHSCLLTLCLPQGREREGEGGRRYEVGRVWVFMGNNRQGLVGMLEQA